MSNYKPGDVANGYVLQPDGHWVPLQQRPSAGSPKSPLLKVTENWTLAKAFVVTFVLMILWWVIELSHAVPEPIQWFVFFAFPLIADVLIVCAVVKRRPEETTASLVARRVGWSVLGAIGAVVFVLVALIKIVATAEARGPQPMNRDAAIAGFNPTPEEYARRAAAEQQRQQTDLLQQIANQQRMTAMRGPSQSPGYSGSWSTPAPIGDPDWASRARERQWWT